MRKLNNKGYMLVEIILAFAIGFAVLYFIMDLVIKLKNKNDDLMVETLVKTDQTIITNKLMDYAIDENEEFNCDDLSATDHSVTYKDDLIVVINKYSKIDKSRVTCENNLGKVSIKIPLSVKQMKENYDIDFDYKYRIGDMVAPTCSLSVSGTTITATYSDNEGGSGLDENKINIENVNYTKNASGNYQAIIDRTGEYPFQVYDKAGNIVNCSIEIISTKGDDCDCEKCGGGCAGYGAPSCSCSFTFYSVQHSCELAGGRWSCTQTCNSWNPTYPCRCKTCYSCNAGYTKINDSYCYKVIE